jgi:uncharacterized protein (DUF305 family)
MKQHPLLYALIGFIVGGLVVSAAGRWLPTQQQGAEQAPARQEALMSDMTNQLKDKKGDDFDSLFISHMIEHHQAAVDMSRLSAANAKHDEIKKLSAEIIAAQEKEIGQMKQWQKDWGYAADAGGHHMHH